MKYFREGLIVAAASLALCGCAAGPRTTAVYVPPAAQQPDDDAVDLLPPVPTFTTIADCELAYGPGECGTGGDIYARANMPPPPEMVTWYMPYSYGLMTGVLVNRYFAPPVIYVPTVQYATFVSPVVVQKYRLVNETHVVYYQRAPVPVQREVVRSGPVRYSPQRATITARPYAVAPRPPVQPVAHPVAPIRPGPTATVPNSRPVTATPATPPGPGSAQPRTGTAPYATPTPKPIGSNNPQRPVQSQQAVPNQPKKEAPAARAAPVPAQPKKEAPQPVTKAPPVSPQKPAPKHEKPCNPNQPKSPTNCS